MKDKMNKSNRIKPLVMLVAILLIGMGLIIFPISTENEGAPLGDEFLVNTYTFSNQDSASAAMNDTGNFVIAWQSWLQDGDSLGIYAQRFDSAGNPQGIEFQVNTNITDNQAHPSVAMNSTSAFVIAWESNGYDGSGYGIYAQRYDNAGNPLGTEFRVNTYNTSDQRYPSIAMDPKGNFVIVWQSWGSDGEAYGISAQRYDYSGSALGPEFRVNTYNTSDQRFPAVAMDSSGNFVITWESSGQDGFGRGIFTRLYDSSGTPLGSEFQVNTYTLNDQIYPSVAMDSSGNFVITWASWGPDGDAWGVFAQRYDSSGIPLGTEFQVNTYTINSQWASSVAMDSIGNFVITWMSMEQDGSWGGVYAQHYDKDGNPQGIELQVNTYTPNDQNNPSIAMDSAGNYVIAWESNLQDGSNYGIYVRRFDNRIPLLIFNIQVQDITDTKATITWESILPANSSVEYGFSPAYGLTVENNSQVTFHSMNLTDLEPGRLYHFRVASYNDSKNYSISEDFIFTTKFPINLEPGWNMISVPLNQTDSDLGMVLENISGDYDAVYWYDVNDPVDFWKLNHTGKPPFMNDLSDISRHMGIWVHITDLSGTTLYVNGTAPEIGYLNQITLYGGWNFVGYPSLIERAPGSAGLPPGVDVVQWYNTSSGMWENWDPSTLYNPDTFTLMKPGQGLWIHYNGSSDVWSLEYVN